MDLASILDKISLTMLGMIFFGIFAVLSVVMMMGNVLGKGKYGGAWAAFGGVCILLAGGLLLINKFAPTALAKNEEPQHTASAAGVQTTPTTESEKTSTSAASGVTGNTKGIGALKGQEGAEGEDLGWLLTVMQALKDGQPIPQEYLAMLPDGGKSLATQQAASGQTQGISKPLATQLTAIARDQGKTSPRATASNYVPQSPYVGVLPAPNSTNPASNPATGGGSNTGNGAANGGGSNAGNGAGNGGTTPPVQQPPVQQTPQPAPAPTPAPTPPPVQQPPAAGTLVDGGLLKSVLGKSKADVQNFFRYNQSLGENGNVLSYYRGSMAVDVTINNDKATHVTLRFDRFNPPGQDRAYYETYMLGMAGMSQANPTSRNGSTATWSNVYSGASNVSISIDLASNSGRVEASR